MTAPALRLEGVTVELGGRRVLDGLSLAVGHGEIAGVLGPNGAGKTTLLRTALGLVRPLSGAVQIEGKPPRKSRAEVGYVPQKHAVDWNFPMTVGELVLTGRVPRQSLLGRTTPEDGDAARSALERVGLTGLTARPIAELSGGQRQRALIARALALEPRLLLLDEPFTGVDVVTQEDLTTLITGLAGEGVCVVMTTHDLPQASELCTRLCLLSGGLRADGTPEEVLESPALAELFGQRTADQLALLRHSRLSQTQTAPTEGTRR